MYLLHSYIYEEKDMDRDKILSNIIGVVICALLTVQPDIITATDVELLCSSIDVCDEVSQQLRAAHMFRY
jgi:hypothetical protein